MKAPSMEKDSISIYALLVTTVMLFSTACNSPYLPKPRGYYKIELPEKAYQHFQLPGFPYTFEYPVYGKVVKDSSFFGEETENPYWINIDFPRFNGRIYISYNIIGGKSVFKVKNKQGQYVDSSGTNRLEQLVKGSYDLTYKHSYKASSIEDSVFRTPNGIEGIFFKVGGNTATANQFLVTDSVKHFLRGALYFDATPNEDSLSTVNKFLQDDMRHLINTLKWNLD